jgi:hypothetical protein
MASGRVAESDYRQQRCRAVLAILVGFVDVVVEHVALSKNVSNIGDAAVDGIQREMMHGPRFGNHVFFNHQTAHIVGSKLQSHLANLFSLSHPGRLKVRHVVQIQTADCLCLEILKRARRISGQKVVHLQGILSMLLKDRCTAKGQRHPLTAMLAVVVAAMLCKFEGYESVAHWVRLLPIEFWHAFGGTRKPPCANCYRELMNEVCPLELEWALNAWITEGLGLSFSKHFFWRGIRLLVTPGSLNATSAKRFSPDTASIWFS